MKVTAFFFLKIMLLILASFPFTGYFKINLVNIKIFLILISRLLPLYGKS